MLKNVGQLEDADEEPVVIRGRWRGRGKGYSVRGKTTLE